MSSNSVTQQSGRAMRGVSLARTGRLVAILLGLVLVAAPRAVQAEPTVLDAASALRALETPTDDLIRMASEYADAVRDLKIARLNLETVQRLKPNAIITNLEVQIAALNMEAAQRKAQVLRVIVEKQLSAGEDRIEVIKQLEKLGAQTPTQRNYELIQAEATVKILRMILAMD